MSNSLAHCEIACKWDGPKPPAAIHGSLRLKLLPLHKAKATADCLENLQPSDEDREWLMKATFVHCNSLTMV
jgi:hypothetical protein